MSEELVDVRLLEVPVRVWARSHEQSEALQREFALVSEDPSGLPARLAELVPRVKAQYAASTGPQEEQLLDAAEDGVEVLPELHYRVPPAIAGAAQEVARVFEEADRYCREGEHLLTLAPDEEVVRFRAWFLGEFVAQVHGRPPVPWPQHDAG